MHKPSKGLPWAEKLNQFQIHPDAASADDVAKMAGFIASIRRPDADTCWDGEEHKRYALTIHLGGNPGRDVAIAQGWCARCGMLLRGMGDNSIPTMFDEIEKETIC